MIDALRGGGDLLNVFGDFPTLTDPRHADAYSPLWDAQLGLWTPKAVTAGLNTRQINENQVFNLAATRPDLLTGVDPATGKPAPYGSAGVDINCAVIGYTAAAPTANLAPPAELPVPPALTTAPGTTAGPARPAVARSGKAPLQLLRASLPGHFTVRCGAGMKRVNLWPEPAGER